MAALLLALLPWMLLLGRLMFAVVFIDSGVNHLRHRATMAGYAKSKGLPAASLAVPLSGLWIIAGGLMVAAGWHRFIGAVMLFVFMIPTAFMMHPYWKERDPQVRSMEKIQFVKDISLAGAALVIAYFAGDDWPLSL